MGSTNRGLISSLLDLLLGRSGPKPPSPDGAGRGSSAAGSGATDGGWADVDYTALSRRSAPPSPAPAVDGDRDSTGARPDPATVRSRQEPEAAAAVEPLDDQHVQPWPTPPAPAPTATAPEPDPSALLKDARRRGDDLVAVCIDLADRLRDSHASLWDRLLLQLGRQGITAVIPDGERFDASAHEAVERRPTREPARVGTVASTLFAGFREGDTWIRRPRVAVYVLQDEA